MQGGGVGNVVIAVVAVLKIRKTSGAAERLFLLYKYDDLHTYRELRAWRI